MQNDGTKRDLENRALFELIDKDGRKRGHYGTAQAAADAAAHFFPDKPQDTSGDHEEPNGWYVEAVR